MEKLRDDGEDVDLLKKKISELIVKTMISIQPSLVPALTKSEFTGIEDSAARAPTAKHYLPGEGTP